MMEYGHTHPRSSVLMRIVLYMVCSVWSVAAQNTDRLSEHGLCAIYSVITHQWTAHPLTEVCCSVCTLSSVMVSAV